MSDLGKVIKIENISDADRARTLGVLILREDGIETCELNKVPSFLKLEGIEKFGLRWMVYQPQIGEQQIGWDIRLYLNNDLYVVDEPFEWTEAIRKALSVKGFYVNAEYTVYDKNKTANVEPPKPVI